MSDRELFEYDEPMTSACKGCGTDIEKGDMACTINFGLYYLCEECTGKVNNDE